MSHDPKAPAKLKKSHPWRGWMDKPPKDERTEYNHPALPSKLSRPI